jgi:hypothetical protein
MTTLSPCEFWLKAAEWSSYMSSGDPGACMYGFDETGAVQSEAHRQHGATRMSIVTAQETLIWVLQEQADISWSRCFDMNSEAALREVRSLVAIADLAAGIGADADEIRKIKENLADLHSRL